MHRVTTASGHVLDVHVEQARARKGGKKVRQHVATGTCRECGESATTLPIKTFTGAMNTIMELLDTHTCVPATSAAMTGTELVSGLAS